MASPSNLRTGLGGPTKAHRRFFFWLAGTFLFVMAAFSAVNTWINPFWVTPMPWTDDAKFAEYRQIYRGLRTAKAGLARSKQWDVALIGSSRVAIALDPAMKQWGDQRVVNLGLSGGSLTEYVAMVDFLFEKQKNLKTIYLGVDPTDMTETADLARGAGFYESPMNPGGDKVERELRYITGVSSFLASMKTLKTRSESLKDPDKLPPYTALGHWLRHRSQRSVRSILESDSIPLALRMIRIRNDKLEIAANKRKALEEILEKCLSRGVEVRLLIPANHAAFLSVFYIDHDKDPSMSLVRRAVLEIAADANKAHPSAKPVTVWDFADFHPLNAEPLASADEKGHLHYWADGTHCLETLGHVMLKRMNGWPVDDPKEADYGREITLENLPARLEEIQAQYDVYRNSYPGEIRWVEQTIRKFASVRNTNTPPQEEEGPNPP